LIVAVVVAVVAIATAVAVAVVEIVKNSILSKIAAVAAWRI